MPIEVVDRRVICYFIFIKIWHENRVGIRANEYLKQIFNTALIAIYLQKAERVRV